MRERLFPRQGGMVHSRSTAFLYWIIVGGLVIRADGNPALARGAAQDRLLATGNFYGTGYRELDDGPRFSPGSAIRTPSAIRTGIGALSNSRPTNTKFCKKSIPRSRSWRTTISSPIFAAVSLRAERSCWSPGQCEWTRPIRQNGHEIKNAPSLAARGKSTASAPVWPAPSGSSAPGGPA